MTRISSITAGARIAHVHLKVADLDRSLDFYCGVLGFELQQRTAAGATFISADGYHHHIGLNTWQSKGYPPPPGTTTGFYNTAIVYPTRPALADALHRVFSAGIALDGASDHGATEALYVHDPDVNGLELCWIRPQEQWPRTPDGRLAIFSKDLDLDDLLKGT
ncbi:catechol 2,3-dioxygenase [Nitrobacteraceae bacterium AZCC 1564]